LRALIVIHVKTDPFVRQLTDIARKQVPFANAQAVNAVARAVIADETAAMPKTFSDPRAFTKQALTQRGFGGMSATKKLPIAIIVAKPIQANYLAPSESPKTVQFLGKGKKIRTPVGVKLNKSHDIPADTIKAMLVSKKWFYKEIRGLKGLWESRKKVGVRSARYRNRAKMVRPRKMPRLMVAFTAPVHVKTNMAYRDIANAAVIRTWIPAFNTAILKALATAKP
jgi:hypothetical protein